MSFAFPVLPYHPEFILTKKCQCDTWIPPFRSISVPAAVVVTDRQHSAPFSGVGLMTGVSVFLNRESPVTQICLFLIVVCIFRPFRSALPPVYRSFFLLFPSSHTVYAHWPNCSSVSSFHSVLCLVGDLFIYINVLPLFLSTIIFLLILQQINVSLSFFPYNYLPYFPGTLIPQ